MTPAIGPPRSLFTESQRFTEAVETPQVQVGRANFRLTLKVGVRRGLFVGCRRQGFDCGRTLVRSAEATPEAFVDGHRRAKDNRRRGKPHR